MVQKTNAFESGARKSIPAVLVYAKTEVGGVRRTLMVNRDAKPDDFHAGKWNGLGGKCEADESPLQTAVRELREESGLDLPESAFQPLGVITFPNFKPHKSEDWVVFVFIAKVKDHAQAWSAGPEGSLAWVTDDELLGLPTWEGDRHFLPHVLQATPFMGTVWYEKSRVTKHWIQSTASVKL